MIRAASRASAPRRALSTSRSVAFVGLGNMGGHMAANLLRAGHRVTVFDLDAAAVETAVRAGAAAASSPGAAAAAADAVVTMLPTPAVVRDVYLGAGGVVERAREGCLFVDSSTVDPGTAQAVARAAEGRGHRMVDAPVSGGVNGARDGTLTFMTGGPRAVHDEAEKLMLDMGKAAVHCGEAVGNGQGAKLCNNLLLAISMAGTAEAMNLGERLGLDAATLAQVINTSTGRCWSSDSYNPVPGITENAPSSRDFEGGFAVDLMRKDLGLAVSAAQGTGASIPLGAATSQLYGILSAAGGGDKDFSSIIRLLQGAKK